MNLWIIIYAPPSAPPQMFTRFIPSQPHGHTIIIVPIFLDEVTATTYASDIPHCTPHPLEIPDTLFKIPNHPPPTAER